MSRPLLEVKDLKVAFPGQDGRRTHAVDGVSFSVEAGRTLGIVGESGCGKSVTSLAVMGLLQTTHAEVSGEVWFEDKDLLKQPNRVMQDLRGSRMAIIFQEPMTSLNPSYFWLGIMLILLFAVYLGWLPASGYVPLWEDWRQSLRTTILPAFVLGNSIAGVIMRHTRSAMLQALQSDYVRTARAKGLHERKVVLKHAMRNALTPVITLGALEFGTLLSGAVLTEQIFTIPGFGKLIVDAVFNRDYAVVQGVVLITATTYIVLNLLADLGYILVNPRLRA